MNKETKTCKKCKQEINKKAKRCHHCGAKQRFPIWIIIIALVVVFGAASANGESSSDGSTNTSENSTNNQEEVQITYTTVTKDELDDALSNNAAAAKDTYNGKYIEVSGKLGTIDSDLKYIVVMSSTNEWDFNGIQCYIKNSEQKEIVKTLSSDQYITIRGKVTAVGEVLGYSLDITEVVAE